MSYCRIQIATWALAAGSTCVGYITGLPFHMVVVAMTPTEFQAAALAWIGALAIISTPFLALVALFKNKVAEMKHAAEMAELKAKLETETLRGEIKAVQSRQESQAKRMIAQDAVITDVALKVSPLSPKADDPSPQKVEIVNTERNPANTHNVE